MGVEPAERSVMRRPPQSPTDSLWSGGMGSRTAWIGPFIGVAALAVGIVYHEVGAARWQSMMFTSLAFLQVAQAFGTRSSVQSLRSMGWASNRLLVWIAALVVGLQLAALYTPLRDFLDLEPVGPIDLALCAGLAVALLTTLEAVKARQGGASKRARAQAGG